VNTRSAVHAEATQINQIPKYGSTSLINKMPARSGALIVDGNGHGYTMTNASLAAKDDAQVSK